MKNRFTFFVILFAIIFAKTNLVSQDFMAASVVNNPKALFINPALVPDNNKFFSLPVFGGINANFNNSFSFSDITEKKDNNYYINPTEFLKILSDANNFSAAKYSVDIFHYGFPCKLIEGNSISLSIRNRMSVGGEVPHDLVELVFDNPLEKHKKFDITSAFKIIGWNEFGVSYSHKINDNLRVGGRLKYLSGMMNIESEKFSYTIEKFQDYYLLSSNLDIRSSNNFNSEAINFNFPFWNNPGVGFDLGAKFQTDDKRFIANASICDIGMISWSKSKATNTITKTPNNKLRFDGFGDLEATLNGESFDLEKLFDSIGTEFKSTIGLEAVEDYSYSSALPLSLQASGTYILDNKFSHRVSLGFAGTSMTSDKFHYAISAGYNWLSENKRWQLLANYTYYGNSANGIGLGAVYNTGKFQVYISAGNIISAFSPLDSKYVGLDIGICFFRF